MGRTTALVVLLASIAAVARGRRLTQANAPTEDVTGTTVAPPAGTVLKFSWLVPSLVWQWHARAKLHQLSEAASDRSHAGLRSALSTIPAQTQARCAGLPAGSYTCTAPAFPCPPVAGAVRQPAGLCQALQWCAILLPGLQVLPACQTHIAAVNQAKQTS